MLFRTQSAAVYGIDADLVDIEVDLTPARNEADTPASVTIVGLPDAAVRESRERIRAAINNSAFFFPFHKTTINLAPADVRKEGASFDLPIALGILGANGDLGERDNLTHALSVATLARRRVRANQRAPIPSPSARARRGSNFCCCVREATEAGSSRASNYAFAELPPAVELSARAAEARESSRADQ